ncbi:leader peptidase (prepilin peptidase)/N-methyltransferase [Caldicoprobacter guelmensis]|uniref:prepilin peptidase n=1 Tax=Caldicoprobacter guelmensis TaxID=1170224 RepID=UPI00195DB347|nr:A24 family peptidase [Caldicoprobacter guelmensis]MBM7581267.1 leader peptidase (prepilin peptidase)/N-methyltransferase [Caldicoprobacter guelmensis]
MDFVVIMFGLVIGSFLNVCIYRIPRGESVAFPGSRCPYCGARLKGVDLIPLISFFLLKGRCRYCGQPISWRYPVVEMLSACLIWLLYRYYGITFTWAYYALMVCILIVVSFIDLSYQEIPNGLVLALMAAGLAAKAAGIGIGFVDGLYGMLVGGAPLALIAVISVLALRREGMGGGDIKLMVAIGWCLGWRLTAVALVLSVYIGGMVSLMLLGLKVKSREDYIPYGPFIALSTVISMIWGESMLYWYVNTFWG